MLYGTGSTRVPGLLLRYGRISNRPVPLHLPPIFRESDAPGYWIRSLLPLGIKTSSSISAASLKSKKRHRLGLQVCTREYAPNQNNKNGLKKDERTEAKKSTDRFWGFSKKTARRDDLKKESLPTSRGGKAQETKQSKDKADKPSHESQKERPKHISTGPGKI